MILWNYESGVLVEACDFAEFQKARFLKLLYFVPDALLQFNPDSNIPVICGNLTRILISQKNSSRPKIKIKKFKLNPTSSNPTSVFDPWSHSSQSHITPVSLSLPTYASPFSRARNLSSQHHINQIYFTQPHHTTPHTPPTCLQLQLRKKKKGTEYWKMDSPTSSLDQNLDLSKLSPKDRQELQQFIVNESQKARIQQCESLFPCSDYNL